MIFESTSEAGTTASETDKAELSAFMVTAMLEFEASLQLLAERACFLTAGAGSAIAVMEAGKLVYCAASGESVAQPGTAVDLTRESVRTSLEKGTANWIEPAAGFAFSLTVPILLERKAVGLIELVGHFPFGRREQASVARLVEMVTVALEHRDAAVAAERGIAGNGDEPHLPPELLARPRGRISAPPTTNGALPTSTPNVQSCSSCGFPVSNSRTLCLDCEQRSSVPKAVQLFSSEVEESWLSAHGYLIASLLVSALAALIIYWFRR